MPEELTEEQIQKEIKRAKKISPKSKYESLAEAKRISQTKEPLPSIESEQELNKEFRKGQVDAKGFLKNLWFTRKKIKK